MGETIHFSEKYMQRLMKGFDVASLTDGLYNHEIDQEFSGVRTVHVNNILTTPLQKYDRTKNIDTGSRYGTTYEVSDDTQTFEMGDEISLSLTIDRANNSDQFNMKKAGDVMQAYKACIAPKKLNRFVAHVDPPRVNGDLLEFLMYHDAFVLGKKADGILVGSMAENICATPTISVTSKKATITSATTTAQIYYTLNGADPRYSKDAKLYSDAVQLTSGDQLRACAKKEGMYTSGVAAKDQA